MTANGILNNEMYIGRLVWNRQHFIKDLLQDRTLEGDNIDK
ncbi:hypothetical protein [Zavarzinia compransoris]|nr:hypothetical protein [Zavarzinia compransoris]